MRLANGMVLPLGCHLDATWMLTDAWPETYREGLGGSSLLKLSKNDALSLFSYEDVWIVMDGYG